MGFGTRFSNFGLEGDSMYSSMQMACLGCLVLVSLSLVVDTAAGQLCDTTEHANIQPLGGGVFDNFGCDVAVSGSTGVVGASWDGQNGNDAGAAYIFDLETGMQRHRLVPADGTTRDFLGRAVAISGDRVLVSAHLDDPTALDGGTVYVFDAATGGVVRKLTPDDAQAFDGFGRAIAIEDHLAVISSWQGTIFGPGVAYVFNVASGEQLWKLIPDDRGALDQQFGHCVDISGNTVIVGSYADDDNGVRSGSAYLFDAISGEQIAKLTPSDGMAGAVFGTAVAISGSRAVVGAELDEENGRFAGAAYVFDTITGDELMKLTPSDAEPYDSFGGAVDIEGRLVFVSSGSGNEVSSGAVYIFNAVSGEELAKVYTEDLGVGFDRFGSSLSASDGRLLVGAAANDNDGTFTGSVTHLRSAVPVCASRIWISMVCSISLMWRCWWSPLARMTPSLISIMTGNSTSSMCHCFCRRICRGAPE